MFIIEAKEMLKLRILRLQMRCAEPVEVTQEQHDKNDEYGFHRQTLPISAPLQQYLLGI